MVAVNSRLQQLDLSSLESISSGGLLFYQNPQLCYVGNLSTYLDNPLEQYQCIGSTAHHHFQPARRDPQTCSKWETERESVFGADNAAGMNECCINIRWCTILGSTVYCKKSVICNNMPSDTCLVVFCAKSILLVNESLICHEQCDSISNCWGPSDTQCDGCRNFRYLRRCVQNCSVVSLPANSRWGDISVLVTVMVNF